MFWTVVLIIVVIGILSSVFGDADNKSEYDRFEQERDKKEMDKLVLEKLRYDIERVRLENEDLAKALSDVKRNSKREYSGDKDLAFKIR